jgi:hypothetical protein
MKKFIITSLISIIVCISTAQAQNGIYATVASGWSFLNGMPNANTINASSVDEKNFPAFRGSIGYVHQVFFSPIGVGFEVGRGLYSNYHYQINDTELKADSSTLEFLGVVRMRLPYHNYIYTKLGGMRNTISVTYQDKKQEGTRIQPMVSLGITHGLFPHSFLDLSYNVSFGQKISNLVPLDWQAPSTIHYN